MRNIKTTFIILTILFISALKGNAYTEIKHVPFLSGFLINKDTIIIQKEYTAAFFTNFGYDLPGGTNLKTLLNGILDFPNVHSESSSPKLDKDSIRISLNTVMVWFISKDIIELNSSVTINLEDLFNKYIRDHIKINKLTKVDFNQIFSDELFSNILQELFTAKVYKFDSVEDYKSARTKLIEYKSKILNKKTAFYLKYIEFMQNATHFLSDLNLSMVQFYGRDTVFNNPRVGKIIGELIDANKDLIGSEFMLRMGIQLSIYFKDQTGINLSLIIQIASKFLGVYSTMPEHLDIQQAGHFMLRFLSAHKLETFDSIHYSWFMSNRYLDNRMETLKRLQKSSLNWFERLRLIELLAVGMTLPKEYNTQSDIRLILRKFWIFGTNHEPKKVMNLIRAKSLLIRNIEYLNEYPELFSELHQSLIMFAANHNEQNTPSIPADIESEWNDYVDDVHAKYTSHNDFFSLFCTDDFCMTEKQVQFPPTIRFNYFFYKLIGILAWVNGTSKMATVTFNKFVQKDDMLAHSFTLEPKVKEVLKFFQKKLAPRNGYNYKVFSGKSISLEMKNEWVTIQKRKADLIRIQEL